MVASASSSPTATKLLATFRFDEFGEPEPGGAGRYGWLGGKSRRTELSSGVIQMGARSYIPQLGRFLTPDPVPGGSANPYDYADQDPVNNFDLNGEKVCINVGRANEACGSKAKQLKRAAHRANKTGKIRVAVHTRQAAQRVARFLSSTNGTRWVKNVQLKAGEIKAAQLYAVQKKIEHVAEEEAISLPSRAWNCVGLRKGIPT